MALQENRLVSRHRVNCPASFAVEDVSGTGTVYNLSEQGCAIESSTAIPDGGYASVSFTLPDHSDPVVVELARVRWVTRGEFGLEFRIVGRSSRRRLQRYLYMDQAA